MNCRTNKGLLDYKKTTTTGFALDCIHHLPYFFNISVITVDRSLCQIVVKQNYAHVENFELEEIWFLIRTVETIPPQCFLPSCIGEIEYIE